MEKTLRELWHDIVLGFRVYLRHGIKRAIAFAIAGFVLGWLVNVALIGFAYDGADKPPPGSPATGDSNLVLGSVFWLLASTVLFAVIGFRVEVGRQVFWTDVRTYPRTLRLAFSTLGANSLNVLLWGFAGAMLIELMLQPAVTGALALGVVLAATARVLRPVIAEMFMVVWRAIAKLFSAHHAPPPASIVVTVATIGGIAAALLGIFVEDLLIRLVLIAAALVIAVVLGLRSNPAAPAAGTLALVVLGVGVGSIAALRPTVTHALDGGFEECGGDFFAWLHCAGSGLVFGFAAVGGGASSLGATLGGLLGGSLASPRAGPGPASRVSVPSPPTLPTDGIEPGSLYGPALGWPSWPAGSTPPSTSTAPASASPAPAASGTVDVVVSGQDAINLLTGKGIGPVTVGGRSGYPVPGGASGIGYSPLLGSDGQPVRDPTTGAPLMDPEQPIALVTQVPAPTGAVATRTGAEALQALTDAGFPAARDPKSGTILQDPATGNPYLRADSSLIHGNVTGMAFGTKNVNGVDVIDPNSSIVVTTQGPAPPVTTPTAPASSGGTGTSPPAGSAGPTAPPGTGTGTPGAGGGAPPPPPPPPPPPQQKTETISLTEINKNIPGRIAQVKPTDSGAVAFVSPDGSIFAAFTLSVENGKLSASGLNMASMMFEGQAQAALDTQTAGRIIDSVRVDSTGIYVTWHPAK